MAENVNQPLVGKEGPPSTVHVDKSRIRQFAKSIGLTAPVYFDDAAAKAAGYPSLIAPPTLPIGSTPCCAISTMPTQPSSARRARTASCRNP